MTRCLMTVRHLSNCSGLLILFLRDHFDVLYQGENSVFVSAVIAYSQTSRKRPPKCQDLVVAYGTDGHLQESNQRGSLPGTCLTHIEYFMESVSVWYSRTRWRSIRNLTRSPTSASIPYGPTFHGVLCLL